MTGLKSKSKGDIGEQMATQFLEHEGCRILQRNYRYDRGEIDIVAEDRTELVFVEVKSRHTRTHGSPEEAVTPEKEQYLKRTAEGYLLEHGMEGRLCRFDLVAIDWHGEQADVRHFKSIF
ncbi:MAG TPA: YraN family protein [Bacteroidota bacterium]